MYWRGEESWPELIACMVETPRKSVGAKFKCGHVPFLLSPRGLSSHHSFQAVKPDKKFYLHLQALT